LIGFFNQEWVQAELGVPVNFSANSIVSEDIILSSSGDPIRREGMKELEYLLANGVTVALIYGDRDQRCPWLGGEKLSLAAQWSGAESFNAAGYEYVRTNDSYNGGVVRQHGNLSFVRVFEAGHDRTYFCLFHIGKDGT
jgi:carboxypeptidase C (cathepsin A)